MHIFRIVGGTDLTPAQSQTEPRRGLTTSGRISFRAADDQPSLTITRRNKRLREQRYDVWRTVSASTHYWRAMLDLHDAIMIGQGNGIPELSRHPPKTYEDRGPLLENLRKAEINQLLTPAPSAALVKWKQQVFAQGKYVKEEQIEKAIADDLAFLAAHPARRARMAPRH